MSRQQVSKLFFIRVLALAVPMFASQGNGHGKGNKHNDQSANNNEDSNRNNRDDDRWERRGDYEYRTYGEKDGVPPGWSKGKKTGWGNADFLPVRRRSMAARATSIRDGTTTITVTIQVILSCGVPAFTSRARGSTFTDPTESKSSCGGRPKTKTNPPSHVTPDFDEQPFT